MRELLEQPQRGDREDHGATGCQMIRAADITAEKNIRGAWVLSAIVSGYLTSRQFYGYTKKEATRLFLDKVNGRKENAE